MPAATAPARDAISVSRPTRQKFGTEVIRTISRTVAQPAVTQNDVPLINRFLELAATLDLNPLASEIWLAQMSGRDGGPGRLAILVGRDGYLKISRRDPAFIDVDADCVYEHDAFHVVRQADGTRSIEHSYGHPKDRGRLHGAYAVLRRQGYPDRYFYAPLAQYDKDHSRSAWKYTDAMLIKAAASYIMRTTYGISGPTPADEVGIPLQLPGEGPEAGNMQAPPPLDSAVAPLWERVKAVDAQAFNEGELRARTTNATPAQVNQVAHELEAWLREHEPVDAEVVEGDVVEDNRSVGQVAQDEVDSINAHEVATNRYRTDEDWRQRIYRLMSQQADLEAALGEQPERSPEILPDLNRLDAAIRDAGVPEGWTPPSETETQEEEL